MNAFTLKFKDVRVEQQFQKSKVEVKQKIMEWYAPLVCLITLIILIHSIIMQFISILILSSIFFILQLLAYYTIVRNRLTNSLSSLPMAIILSMIVSLQFLAILDNTIPHSEINWILDICLLLSINYVLSTDISWNSLFFTLNLVLRLYIRFSHHEFSILSIVFIICSLISFYNEYLRILNLRLEFKLEEENQSSHTIFDTFQEKSIIILTYDDKNMKFHLKFQNACSIHYFQEFTREFLKTMRIVNRNLGQFMYQSIKGKDYSVKKFVGRYVETYFNVTYQVTRSTEIQIFIIITKKQETHHQLVKPIFYRALLMKVKKLNNKLFHQEVLKNMIYNLMKYKKDFVKLQFKEIKPGDLSQFFQVIFKQAKIICQVDHPINNHLIMIEAALLLINKYFKVSQCTICKSDSGLINIILKGSILSRSISNAKKELFGLILLQIGTGTFTEQGSTITFELIDFKDFIPYK